MDDPAIVGGATGAIVQRILRPLGASVDSGRGCVKLTRVLYPQHLMRPIMIEPVNQVTEVGCEAAKLNGQPPLVQRKGD